MAFKHHYIQTPPTATDLLTFLVLIQLLLVLLAAEILRTASPQVLIQTHTHTHTHTQMLTLHRKE